MKYKKLVEKVLELEKIVKGKEKDTQEKREKITLKEFCDSKEELAIHCDTEEKAKWTFTEDEKVILRIVKEVKELQ